MPRTSRIGIAAYAAASLLLLSAPRVCAQSASPFTFDDVHFWVGSGTNSAVVLLDWGASGLGAGLNNSIAWGVRWNGTLTQYDALNAIVAEDGRLEAVLTGLGGAPNAIAYDLNNNGGGFNLASGSKTDAGDVIGWVSPDPYDSENAYYWCQAELAGTAYSADFSWSTDSANVIEVTPNSFVGFKYILWFDESTGEYLWGEDGMPLDDFVPRPPVAAEPPPFVFADVTFWTGSGTNSAVALIDFGDAGDAVGFCRSLAYGVRWNGAISQYKALKTIVADDPRLHAVFAAAGDGSPKAFAYDVDGEGGRFNFANGAKSDAGDVIGWVSPDWMDDDCAYYWCSSELGGKTVYTNDFQWCGDSAGTQNVAPGSFFGFKYIPRMDLDTGTSLIDLVSGMPLNDFIPRRPAAASSPYGWRVTHSKINTSAPLLTFGCTDTNSVLGRPTTIDIVDYENGDNNLAPVTPFLPASSKNSIFCLSYTRISQNPNVYEQGTVTIEFDHPVVDHPNNPWGRDFIVFGNTFYSRGNHNGKGDPSTVLVSLGVGDEPEKFINPEPGLVEVSQDGETWHALADGQFADGFAPTLGYRYDPANADASLFAGNQWWSVPTDPTYPVAPNAESFITVGTNLATIAKYYGRSAGGTAFDISALPLPVDAKGRKWFKFVRITNNPTPDDIFTACEIDAVAAVYPDTEWELWRKDNYDWAQLADPAVSGKTAVPANGNGMPNYYNFALGHAWDQPAPDLQISGFEVKDGRMSFSFPVWKQNWTLAALQEAEITLAPQIKTTLSAPGWSSGAELEQGARFEGLAPGAAGQSPHTATVSLPMPDAPSAFFKLAVSAED